MTRRFVFVAPILATTVFALPLLLAAARTADDEPAAVRKVLDDQVTAWNKKDLEGFLKGYWKSPQVVFQSGVTRSTGFDAMRERYRKNYLADGKEMGTLVFSGVEIEILGADAAFVRGRFTLTMSDGKKPTGLYTLIVRKFSEGWRIVHDHTST